MKTFCIGVPQGSIFGLLLFILYINDLTNVSNIVSSVLFADETAMFASYEDWNGLVNRVKELAFFNRLSLNADKTFAMLFSNRNSSVDKSYVLTLDGKPGEVLPSLEVSRINLGGWPYIF